MRGVRFALAGCSRISANHLDALDKHTERAELVGVCDVDAGALARAVERTAVRGVKSLEAMLAGGRKAANIPRTEVMILVTGGAGYIGSVRVRQLLVADHHVRVPDNLMVLDPDSRRYANS